MNINFKEMHLIKCTKNILLITFIFILFLIFLSPINSCNNSKTKNNESQTPALSTTINIKGENFEILKATKKLNPSVYTQGIFISKQNNKLFLYESAGLYGKSAVNKLDYPSLQTYATRNLPPNQFGEGIAIHNNILYQLTWREKVIRLYTVKNLNFIKEIDMPSEMTSGWGLSVYDNNYFVATDGTNNIYLLKIEIKLNSNNSDINSLKKNEYKLSVDKVINVALNLSEISIYDFFKSSYTNFLDKSGNVTNLNEIRVIRDNDKVYALLNIYYSPYIIKVDLDFDSMKDNESKKVGVNKVYDFTSLLEYEINNGSLTDKNVRIEGYVLNGIARLKSNLYILTGKGWSFFYEVELK